jgi:hypothetical protein
MKIVKIIFPNKKKRTCYNRESTKYFIVMCPHEKKENKHNKREGKLAFEKNRKYRGGAHIGHEWNSSKESSSEEVKRLLPLLFTSHPPRQGSSRHVLRR